MTSGKKLTYAELLAEKKKLERRIEDTEAAMKAADRHMVRSSYHATEEWIAIPLREQQLSGVREYFEDRKRYDEREQFADFRRYTEIHDECSVLPEFQHYLIRYETDNEGNDISSLKVWGLVPVSSK